MFIKDLNAKKFNLKMNYKWPLNVQNATWLDRLKLAGFVLNPANRWTQDKYVAQFEIEMAKFVGCQYVVFVSSGSAANTILFMYLRDKLKEKKSKRNIVVVPSTTWITAISPVIREGFIPHFIDITVKDFSMNLSKLEEFLEKKHKEVACVFITSLLGFSPDIDKINKIKAKYPNIKIFFDNCESGLTEFYIGSNISSSITSTTSTYFGHCINSNEGGFLFTNNPTEYNYFLMLRNHGMTRSLIHPTFYTPYSEQSYDMVLNPLVDARFDFYCLGNNFRNTEFNALTGLLDIKRVEKYKEKRKVLFDIFASCLSGVNFILPERKPGDVPFSLPIIIQGGDSTRFDLIKSICVAEGIETRPIISGCLLDHTCLRKYKKNGKFPVSEYIGKFGFYIGLYSKLKERKIINLVEKINKC